MKRTPESVEIADIVDTYPEAIRKEFLAANLRLVDFHAASFSLGLAVHKQQGMRAASRFSSVARKRIIYLAEVRERDRMKTSESNVPSYAYNENTGGLMGPVKSRVAWIKKHARSADGKVPTELLERLAKKSEDLDSRKEQVIAKLIAMVESLRTNEVELSTIASTANALLCWHDDLRDIAAYEFLREEAEAASNVVRLPVAGNAQYADIDKLSPYNRRRALAVIEQMVRKQQGVEEGES